MLFDIEEKKNEIEGGQRVTKKKKKKKAFMSFVIFLFFIVGRSYGPS